MHHNDKWWYIFIKKPLKKNIILIQTWQWAFIIFTFPLFPVILKNQLTLKTIVIKILFFHLCSYFSKLYNKVHLHCCRIYHNLMHIFVKKTNSHVKMDVINMYTYIARNVRTYSVNPLAISSVSCTNLKHFLQTAMKSLFASKNLLICSSSSSQRILCLIFLKVFTAQTKIVITIVTSLNSTSTSNRLKLRNLEQL